MGDSTLEILKGPNRHGANLVMGCYNPGSSLCKRNDLQGKDGLTSVLQDLTNGSAWTDAEDDIRRVRMGSIKGQSLMVAAEAGMEDTGSDGY